MKNRKGVNCSIGGGGASKIKPVSRETATVTLWTLMSPQANVSQPPNESWHMHDRSSHHQAQLSPLQVVTHLVSLMPWQCTPEECCVITCTPSMNNVWTQKTQNINARGKKWKKWVLYIHMVCDIICIFFMIFKAKLTFSASLYCLSTTIPYPPLHVIISSESTLESTRAPFAMTYGEQGRDCKRVALSGAVT